MESVIVLDMGNYSFKSGLAGEEVPKSEILSYVGTIKDPSMMDLESPIMYAGEKMLMRRDFMKIEPSLTPSIKWNLVECLISESFSSIKSDPKESPLIISENTLHDIEMRHKTCEIFFEKFQVPFLYSVKKAALASFAHGRATSLVVDSAGYSTQAVPIHEGFVLQKFINKQPLGGDFVTEHFYQGLRNRVTILPSYSFTKIMRNCYAEPGQPISDIECSIEKKYFPNTDPSFHDFAVREIINNIKESTFKISEFPNQETARVQYKLPDETLLELGNERFRIPEVFFIGNEEFPGFSGVHNMAVDSINKCSLGIKRELFNNIILTGGNSTFEGFSEKFMKRVHDLTPNGLKARVLSVNSRKYSTWIGGSILGVISGFRPMMISKQDYEETGVGMIDKKCP